MQKTVPVENVAQAYLELLEARGIDCFFGNGGTDFASLVDAFARRAADGKRANVGAHGLVLRPAELAMLLDGIDVRDVKRHKRYQRPAPG